MRRIGIVERRIGIVERRIGIAEGYIGIVERRIGIAEGYIGIVERRIGIVEGCIGIAKLTAEFKYLNHIYRRGTALLCPYRVVYLPENSCNFRTYTITL
ncbi:MAG: hypothetical protein V7K35_07700 [Nostoc sp.]|uniref:hypothetical protein n=1 Tax=Nostoc sp. TaxID=1180 RepID=UPI002FFACD1E